MENNKFSLRICEIELSKLFDLSDASRIAEEIIDDVVDDVNECADVEYNDSDVRIAICRVIKKRMGIEE